MKKKRLTMGKKFILTLSIATVCYQAYAEHYKIRVVYKDTPKTTSTAVSSLYSVVNDSQHGKSAVLTVDPSAELQSKIQECVGDNIYVSNEKYIEQYGVSPEAFCAARIMSDDNSNIKYALPVGVKSRISSHNIISNDSDEYTGINVTQWFRQDWDMGNQVEWSGIDAPGAWAYLTGRSLSTVHIAVIDSGIAVRSAYDFRSRINDLNSYHFYPNFTTGEVVMDDDIYATVEFHGTHVGGTIIANGPNVTGVVGNIPEAQAYALRVLNDDNVGNDASMNFAELWAVNQLKNPMVIDQYPYLSTFIDNPLPAKILNQSYGASRYNNAGEPTSSLDFWVINSLIPQCSSAKLRNDLINATGAVQVMAAGNDSHALINDTNSGCPNIKAIVVESTQPNSELAPYSTRYDAEAVALYAYYGEVFQAAFGEGVVQPQSLIVRAPGGNTSEVIPGIDGQSGGVFSTWNCPTESGSVSPTPYENAGCYNYLQGTSMATPHVSGIIAMIYMLEPNANYDYVAKILEKSKGPKGILNARKVVENVIADQNNNSDNSNTDTGWSSVWSFLLTIVSFGQSN